MSENERVWSVYKHTSPSGKVYIGIAKNIKQRWRSGGNGYRGCTRIWCAIQKYGWDNFKHEIIVENLTQKEASETEIALIKKHNATDPAYGYNLTFGGYNGKLSLESRAKISASLMGHPVSDKVRAILRESHSKPLICLETKEVFESAQDVTNKLGLCRTSVLKAANGRQEACGGYHFAVLSDYESGQIKKFVPSPAIHTKVRCVTTGEEFENISDASRKTGITRRGISYACNGVHATCGGMRWEFIHGKEDGNG